MAYVGDYFVFDYFICDIWNARLQNHYFPIFLYLFTINTQTDLQMKWAWFYLIIKSPIGDD